MHSNFFQSGNVLLVGAHSQTCTLTSHSARFWQFMQMYIWCTELFWSRQNSTNNAKKQERQGATQTARHRGGKIKEDQTALKPTCQKRKQSHILAASRSFPFVLQENWCCLTRIGSNSVSLRKCQMIHLGHGFGLLIHSGILKMLHRLATT